jgi:DDE superfamily endonuclease
LERADASPPFLSQLCAPRLSLGVWRARAADWRSLPRDCHYPRHGYPRHGYPRHGYPRHGYPRHGRLAAWLRFLDGLETFAPPGEAYLIADALPLHWSIDTMLWNWGHPRFHFVPLPKRAAWLNLIEGFWKILRQRALDGRV